MARPTGIAALAALLTLIATPRPAAAQPSSPEERAAAVARPAIVLVQVGWHGWVRDTRTGEVFGGTTGYQVTVSCTGAVIHPDGYVATASHCVHTGPAGGGGVLFEAAIAELAGTGRVGDPTAAKRVLAEHAVAEGAAPDSPVGRVIQVERMTGGNEPARDIAPATVVELVTPSDGDLAVLKIPRDRLPAMELRPDPPPVGTPILAIGYPTSAEAPVDPNLEPSNRSGQISAHRTLRNRPFYEFSAAASGMSGGPVVDTQGRMVGLTSGEPAEDDPSANLASAAATLTEVLRGKGITAALGPHDRNYRAGLEEYFAGDFDDAVGYFDAVLTGAPSHRQAGDYRRLAIEQGGSAGSGVDVLAVIAIGCAAVAVLAATLGTTVLLARRRRALSAMDTPPYGVPLLPVPPAGAPRAEDNAARSE